MLNNLKVNQNSKWQKFCSRTYSSVFILLYLAILFFIISLFDRHNSWQWLVNNKSYIAEYEMLVLIVYLLLLFPLVFNGFNEAAAYLFGNRLQPKKQLLVQLFLLLLLTSFLFTQAFLLFAYFRINQLVWVQISKQSMLIAYLVLFVCQFIVLNFVSLFIYKRFNSFWNRPNYFLTLTNCLFLFFTALIFISLNGEWLIIILFLTIMMANDTFAYLGGSLFGRKKLLPKISPNKTFEGLIVGLLFGFIAGFGYFMILRQHQLLSLFLTLFPSNFYFLIIVCVILFVLFFGNLGDLFFSFLKRRAKIKDFQALLPGHGGVLDRFDALIFVLPCYFLVNLILVFRQ